MMFELVDVELLSTTLAILGVSFSSDTAFALRLPPSKGGLGLKWHCSHYGEASFLKYRFKSIAQLSPLLPNDLLYSFADEAETARILHIKPWANSNAWASLCGFPSAVSSDLPITTPNFADIFHAFNNHDLSLIRASNPSLFERLQNAASPECSTIFLPSSLPLAAAINDSDFVSLANLRFSSTASEASICLRSLLSISWSCRLWCPPRQQRCSPADLQFRGQI